MSKKDKKNKITTRTDIVFSSIALLAEIGIGLALIVFVIFLSLKLATTCYSIFTNQFDKHDYVETLIDDNVFNSSNNLNIVKSGEVTDGQIIVYYWLSNLNFVIVLILIVLCLEKVRKFFDVENVDNPFTDNSLGLFQTIIKYSVIVLLVEILIWVILAIFTPFDMEFVFDIGIIEIACVFFVYYLLRKGNEMFNKKKTKE